MTGSMMGTTPPGVQPGDEASASRYVRQMFARVAPRYDLLNHLLSFQVDRYWRRRAVEKVQAVAARPEAQILDLCCGTGDLIAALSRIHAGPIYGADFCRPMLQTAAAKLAAQARLIEADALALPFDSGRFDVVTIAFGLRNLTNYRHGIAEMHRLLRPGGLLAILEFSQPAGRFLGPLYSVYFRHLLPRLGDVISGAGHAYRYLQQSVEKFLSPEELSQALLKAGFRRVRYWPLTGGIAVLHVGER